MSKPECFHKPTEPASALKKSGAGAAGYSASFGRVYELNIRLPERVLVAVAETAAELESLRKAQLAKLSRPVLTIARFQAREEMEPTLLRWINRILSNQTGFRFAFNNYGSMPGKPLYWRIQDPEPFRKLATGFRVLEGWLQGNGCYGPELFAHPILPLLDELDGSIEREVLMAFSASLFYDVVELQELELLVSEPWTNEYRLVSRFALLPEGFKQSGIDQ
jgi:hypothetical protein